VAKSNKGKFTIMSPNGGHMYATVGKSNRIHLHIVIQEKKGAMIRKRQHVDFWLTDPDLLIELARDIRKQQRDEHGLRQYFKSLIGISQEDNHD
jgi:hypothetical protein